MPKVKRSDKVEVDFSVSPWQSKVHSSASEDVAYVEVQMPLPNQSHKVPGIDRGSEPSPAEHKDPKSSKPHPSAWKRKRIADANEIQEAGLPSSAYLPSTSTTELVDLSYLDEDNAPDEPSPAGLHIVLSGKAFLALLPDGQISGHMVDERSRRCLGVMGGVLKGRRECTRDEEWQLMRMTVIDFKGGSEVSFLAERTGGDAAVFKAPVQLQGVEEEADLAVFGDDLQHDVELDFSCDVILADAAAERHLRKFSSDLCGSGAAVNQGVMKISTSVLTRPPDQAFAFDDDLDA